MDEESLYSEGTRVWIQDTRKPEENRAWICGSVTDDSDSNDIHVQISGGEVKKIKISEVGTYELANPQKFDTVDDLTELSYLHEPGVLHCLDIRFCEENTIYTYCGIVLVAINPYERLNIYDIDEFREKASKDDIDPHIYAVAKQTLDDLRMHKKNQSIIVSGESGAGKTVNAKHVMRYFAKVGGDDKETTIEHKVLASNPVMEAFGNAKTTRNDNSSRFGKYIELRFGDSGSIIGANMRTYLLEKSRVVSHADTERNYHVFYMLCANADKPEFASFELRSADEFIYTNQGGKTNIPIETDLEDFKELKTALVDLGVAEHETITLFGVLAALLHLGETVITGTREKSKIQDEDASIAIASKLLGIDSGPLVKTITTRKIKMKDETIESPNTLDAAKFSRDALVKHIYLHIFDWLVKIVNKSLLPTEKSKTSEFIGVLDIYGFEHFKLNSFEQFCINYANEKLQNQFNKHVFTLEQQEYEKEGISWTWLEHRDNTPCLDLIEKGLFTLLDDQCGLGDRGTDAAFASSVHLKFKDNKYFGKPKPMMGGDEAFIVRHYADDVIYQVKDPYLEGIGFMSKNKDAISADHIMLLSKSKLDLVKQIFLQEQPKKRGGTERAGGFQRSQSVKRKDLQQTTVASVFQASLKGLMDDLSQTEPHYVRCIKPNDKKAAFEFDNVRVVEQLRACGVLETIRISAAGYPGRFTYAEFLERYVMLAKKGAIERAKAKSKIYALPRLALSVRDLEFYEALWDYVDKEKQLDGRMMVHASAAVEFFKLSNLDEGSVLAKIWALAKDDANDNKMAMLKSEFFTACKLVALANDSENVDITSLDLQEQGAKDSVMKELGEKCMIPDFGKGVPPTKETDGPRRASVGARLPRHTDEEKLTCQAVLAQAVPAIYDDKYQIGKSKVFFRAGFVAGVLEKIRDRIIEQAKIKRDATIKAWVTRREFKRKVAATIVLQKYTRGLKDRRYVAHLRMLKELEKQKKAVVVIQAWWRKCLEYKRFMKIVRALVLHWKQVLGVRLFQKDSAVVIQRAFRRWRKKKRLERIVLLQSCMRRWLAKRKLEKLRAVANDPKLLKAKAATLKDEMDKLKEEKQNRVHELKEEMLRVKNELAEKTRELETTLSEKTEMQEALDIAEEQIDGHIGEMNQLKGELAEQEEEFEECKMGLEDNRQQLVKDLATQKTLGAAESERVKMLKSEKAKLQALLEAAPSKDAFLDLESALSAKHADYAHLELKYETLANNHEDLKMRDAKLSSIVEHGIHDSAEMEAMRGEINRLNAENTKLQATKSHSRGAAPEELDLLRVEVAQARAEARDLQLKLDKKPEDLTEKMIAANTEIAKLTLRLDGGDDYKNDEIGKLTERLEYNKSQMRAAWEREQAAEQWASDLQYKNDQLERYADGLLLKIDELETHLQFWMQKAQQGQDGHGGLASGPPPPKSSRNGNGNGGSNGGSPYHARSSPLSNGVQQQQPQQGPGGMNRSRSLKNQPTQRIPSMSRDMRSGSSITSSPQGYRQVQRPSVATRPNMQRSSSVRAGRLDSRGGTRHIDHRYMDAQA